MTTTKKLSTYCFKSFDLTNFLIGKQSIFVPLKTKQQPLKEFLSSL